VAVQPLTGSSPAAGSRPSLAALRIDPELLVLAGVTVAAGALRFSTLHLQSFSHDEAVTAGRVLRPSLARTLSAVAKSESTPPLYYALAWAWTRLFSIGEVGLRSLSALFGTLTVPVSYAAAAAFGLRRRQALIAAALAAVSPMLVWYSQEARAYALLALLGVATLYFFARERSAPSRHTLAGWGITSALALATHYFAVFLVAPQAAWLLATSGGRARRDKTVAVTGVAAVGAALVPLMLSQLHHGHTGWIAAIPLGTRIRQTAEAFSSGPSGPPTPALAVAVAALAMLAFVLLAARASHEERRSALAPLALVVLAVLLPLLFTAGGADYFFPRNLIQAWVPLAIVVAAGCGLRSARRLGLAIAAAICGLSLAMVTAVDVDARLQRTDWRDVAAALGRADGDGALVAPSSGDDPLEYYFRGTHQVLRRHAFVSEVDELGWPLAGSRLLSPGHDFRLVSRRLVDGVTVATFRAPRPRLLARSSLARRKLGAEPPVVLMEGMS
jgi:mannosyltransferase